MNAPLFPRPFKKTLSRERTAFLAGDSRIPGRLDNLPGTEPAFLLFPQTDSSDPWSGLVVPVGRDGKKMAKDKRTAFIARSKRIDHARIAFISGEKNGHVDWWTKLPPEWGNPQDPHEMVHGTAALVPLVVSLLPDGFDGIALYPVPAADGDRLMGAPILVVAKKTGFAVWREASSLSGSEALAMSRRPLIDRATELVLMSGQSPPREELLWIRDDRNRTLPLWEHLSDPSSETGPPLIDRALERPPLVHSSPVVRSRRASKKLRKFGPSLLMTIALGAGLWYYENVILVHDPRTIAALESRRERLDTQETALLRTRTALGQVRAGLAPRHLLRAVATIIYLSGGLSERRFSVAPSRRGFHWTLSGRPGQGLTPSDVRKGLASAAKRLGLTVEKTSESTDAHLDVRLAWAGTIPEKIPDRGKTPSTTPP